MFYNLELSKCACHLSFLDYNLKQSMLKNVPILKVFPYMNMHLLFQWNPRVLFCFALGDTALEIREPWCPDWLLDWKSRGQFNHVAICILSQTEDGSWLLLNCSSWSMKCGTLLLFGVCIFLCSLVYSGEKLVLKRFYLFPLAIWRKKE